MIRTTLLWHCCASLQFIRSVKSEITKKEMKKRKKIITRDVHSPLNYYPISLSIEVAQAHQTRANQFH